MPKENRQQNDNLPINQPDVISELTKIRSSLRALKDAVILIDADDNIEWCNKAAKELLPLPLHYHGNSIFDLINAPEFRQYYHYQNDQYQEERQTQESYQDGLHLPSWQDSKRHLKCELTSFADNKLLIIYDVTRLHHLEQMRRDFVANVSHELRTPLTVLMGYLENFSDQEALSPQWRRGFELMTQQTMRMNRIINDLLLLSKIESEETYQTHVVDMTKLLTDIYDDAQAYNQEYRHTIHLHIDTYDGIYGSEMYLSSALSNLVINAIKYTPKGGNITISWTRVTDGCCFAVTDDGLGIAAEHIEHLTERFYRVDSSRSRDTGGTGLGLAIVKHVLYQHDSYLQIKSTEDVGSTFSAVFPLSRVRSEHTSD